MPGGKNVNNYANVDLIVETAVKQARKSFFDFFFEAGGGCRPAFCSLLALYLGVFVLFIVHIYILSVVEVSFVSTTTTATFLL